MTGVIIDSPILIDALIGLGSARTAIVTAPERYITRLAWAELMGSAKGDEGRVEEFLDNFRIVELTEDIARRGAALRRQQPGMGLADALTLAAAQLTGRILVTRNTKDFPAAMPGIRVPYTL